MKVSTCVKFAAGALVMALAVGASVHESRGAKPQPPPPPPPPPPTPVRFQIQFWLEPGSDRTYAIHDANNLGQAVARFNYAVGEAHGYLYDPARNPSTAIDLNDIADAPEGWVIYSAEGLNDRGAIVGWLAPSIGSPLDPDLRRGYILDTAAESPELLPIPDSQWARSLALRINDNGDVGGVYETADGTWDAYFWHSGLYDGEADEQPLELGQPVHPSFIALNNPGNGGPPQVAGNLVVLPANGNDVFQSTFTGFRWTPGQPLETFAENSGLPAVHDMNDSGTVCGGIFAKLTKKPGTRYPFRYDASLELLTGSDATWARGINAEGDLAAYSSSDAYYYHNELGSLKLTSLIDPNDPNAAVWSTASLKHAQKLTNRDGTGFGRVLGQLNTPDGVELNFLLTPFLP